MVTVDGVSVRALAYPKLVGSPRVGDRVLLNVSALDAGLGTGGYAFVVAIPDRLPPDPVISRGGGLLAWGARPPSPGPRTPRGMSDGKARISDMPIRQDVR